MKSPLQFTRFGTRTLLFGVALIGIGLAWGLHEIREQAAVVAALGKVGGACYEQARPDSLTVLELVRTWFADDHPLDVDRVSLDDSEATDADLLLLQKLPQLKYLHMDRTQITDAGLIRIAPLVHLRFLTLDRTRVTDAGLSHLQGLTELYYLSLAGTQITDAGLVHLRRMKQLSDLDLTGTCVTDEGVEKLQESHPALLVEH